MSALPKKNEKPPIKERMKIPRQPMPEQDPKERIHNFNEVPLGYTEEQAVTEALRCIECKTPKCVQGCPVGIDIKGFIGAIADGDFARAAQIIKKDNLLPAICGRVCPQETQCELYCVRGKTDAPVAIGRLERFVADWERERGKISLPEVKPPTGFKVAVVGSGPGGLTCANECRQRGHEVTIFEALHEPGGVLMYGIPEFRLPKKILQAEVDLLRQMGVNFEFNVIVGKTVTVKELMEEEGYDAVFLGVGAGLPVFMGIDGENLNGVYSANEFLTRSNLMRAYRDDAPTPIVKPKIAGVIGGGNTAMDAARTALRLGAEKVYIIYRRSRTEMPARVEEIHHAEEEGVELMLLTNPVRFLGDDEGNLVGAELIRMELGEPDESGRRRPVPIEGSNFTIELDTVIVAVGTRANPVITKNTEGLKLNKWGYIEVDPETQMTSIPGVFAGGDIVTGSATVIAAMGDGKKAAQAIDRYLREKAGLPIEEEQEKEQAEVAADE